jgi:predicted ArsR family transcriptional regulator
LRPSSDVGEALEAVCSAVRELGFHAVLQAADRERAVIATPTCPLRPLVVERPAAAAIDRGMWTGLVERGLQGCTAADVACETDSRLDGGRECMVVLRFSRSRG